MRLLNEKMVSRNHQKKKLDKTFDKMIYQNSFHINMQSMGAIIDKCTENQQIKNVVIGN